MSHTHLTHSKKPKETSEKNLDVLSLYTSHHNSHEKHDDERATWKLMSPGRYACIGPSHSGKSELVLKIVSSPYIWQDWASNIIYCAPYLEERKAFITRLREAINNVGGKLWLLDTIPNLREIRNLMGKPLPCILILDDLLTFHPMVRRKLEQWMVVESHHGDVTVILCQQKPFPKGPEFVTCAQNMTGRFILYQLNDWRSIVNLNNMMFPGYQNFLPFCLTEAKEALGCNYIFVNSFPFSALKRRYRCYTSLFKEEQSPNQPSPIFFDYENYT